MKMAEKEFELKPGAWFNVAQVGYIIERLQNTRPMKGAERLKVATFNQSVLFLDELYQTMGLPICKCEKQEIICEVCHKRENSEDRISS